MAEHEEYRKEAYRNVGTVPPFITEQGLHYVNPAPVIHSDGTLRKPNRPYEHFLVEDTSNGSPRTTIIPVLVEERGGVFHCQPHRIYAHQPTPSYDVHKPIDMLEPGDLFRLPVLLFPGDRLEHIGGLERVTISEAEPR
ncbi:MAG: hypothetical protein AABX98_02820 [Nanoarchaeota archaeon]